MGRFSAFRNRLSQKVGEKLSSRLSGGRETINVNVTSNIKENIGNIASNAKQKAGDKIGSLKQNIGGRISDYRDMRNLDYDSSQHYAESFDIGDFILLADDLIDVIQLTGVGIAVTWPIDLLCFFIRGKKYGWFNSILFTILELIPYVGMLPFMSWPSLRKVFRSMRHSWHGVRRENPDRGHTDRLKIYLKQGASSGGKFLGVLFIIALLLTGLFWFAENNLGIIPPDLPVKIAMQAQTAVVWFGEFITLAPKRVEDIWVGFFTKVADYSSGGYYESRVDERRKDELNLGVEISDFKGQRSKFYEDEKVAMWFRLRATALMFDDDDDSTLNILTWCSYSPPLKGEDIESKKTMIVIDQYGDQAIDCELEGLKPGSRLVEAHALYDFTTNAYLRTYFMDDSRIRMYRLQNKNPLMEYGISDSHPIGVYTNGPVKVSIGTNEEYPLRVTDNNKISTFFGITIENREKYEGIIRQVTGLEIQIPDGLEFDTEHCDFSPGTPRIEYDDKLDESYKIYDVDLNSGRLSERKLRDIDTYLTINCRLKVRDRDAVLGDDGFAVKYLRAKVNYQYEAYEKATVFVKKVEDESE